MLVFRPHVEERQLLPGGKIRPHFKSRADGQRACPTDGLSARSTNETTTNSIAIMGSRLQLIPGGRAAQLDGRSHQRAVLGPGAVIITYVLVTEQFVEHEPGMGGSLPDAAVCNY